MSACTSCYSSDEPEDSQELSSVSVPISVMDSSSSSRRLCIFFSGPAREDIDNVFHLEDVFEVRDAYADGFLLAVAGLEEGLG